MSFGISKSVKSKEVQVCTPELFHQVIKSDKVKYVCAQIVDAWERKLRGEICEEDYNTLKTQLKAQLPILTPHATFKNGRRINADAIPSGLSIYDKDHIPNPRGYWEEKSKVLAGKPMRGDHDGNPMTVLDCIMLVHVTPSTEGLRLVFVIPEGMNLAEAQKWMSEQLEDEEYDTCVKDLARPSFLVPEDYILYINEEGLFKDRKFQPPCATGDNLQAKESKPKKASEKLATQEELAALVKSVSPVSETFPSDYGGIPYKMLIGKLVELLGGEPEHGSRNTFIFSLACYLRYICDDNAAWIKSVIPTFGEEQSKAFATVDSACNRNQSHRMAGIVSKAVSLCRNELARGRAEDYDADEFGDVNNPDSYFYNVLKMPDKLPKLIKLLVSKTPGIYKPAVSQAVFPSLAVHLCETRFLYVDNVEHEATLMNILCAPTGSGKECITEPINHIMADIRRRDAEQREREREWKDECNRKGSNKDKRERPQGLIIQEVNIDMTNPAFVLRMKEAERHFLFSKINELNLFDSLKGKTNQHFRIMELAFDLGNYGQDRVGTQSVTENVKVRFNWNACCTPKKCRDYFRNVVTDGPISRISFSTIARRPCGSAIPVYGTYDAAFDEALKPYIDNLVKARGLVDCPKAKKLALKLLEENAEFAQLSQNYVFENLSFRATVIAYLKACVLYVANGMKWEKTIEDFIRWSLRYDLWCKLKLFGQMIYDADNDQQKVSQASTGPKNMLALLPDNFTMNDYLKVRREQGFDNENLRRVRDTLSQWIHRGYIVKDILEAADTDSSIFRKLKFRRDGKDFTK